MIIHWGLPNMLTGYAAQKNGIAVQSRFQLIPGNNEIADTEWEDIKKHPLVKQYMSDGVITEVTKPDGKKAGEGLAKFSPEEAKKIIKDTFDLRLLKAWTEKEGREVIKTAIETQIKSIEEKTKKPSKDDNDEDDEE